MKKYRLTEEINGNGLHRIEALIDGPWGPAGTQGGWIASEKNLSQIDTCWVADEARVFGEARVSGEAQVAGTAQVFGKAAVAGDAQVAGTARVFGEALVYYNAQVRGNTQVSGNAIVCGHALVKGKAHVMAIARVSGEAQVSGTSRVSGEARIAGQAQIHDSTDYLCVGPLGSRHAMLTIYRVPAGLEAITGCFVGTLDELRKAVQKTHAGHPQFLADYLEAITYAEMRFRRIDYPTPSCAENLRR